MANIKNGYNVIMQLELGCGDMVLLHPWLARTFAPNLSASSANLLIIHIGDLASKSQGSRLFSIFNFNLVYVAKFVVCEEYMLKCMLWILGWGSFTLDRLCS